MVPVRGVHWIFLFNNNAQENDLAPLNPEQDGEKKQLTIWKRSSNVLSQ
jgi:hypothetical protein